MIEVDKEIYSRSNEIGLKIPDSVCVIGVGGVGGWVSFLFPLMGINNIILIDPDVLEETNLNRLPYKYEHIGEYKVHAMEELIRERRMCNISAYPMKWEDIPQDVRNSIVDLKGERSSIIIDCRDSFTPLEGVKKTYVTGGYDGSNITIHTFPNFENVWGEDEVRYRTTPSYLIPPLTIASMIINFICYEMHYNENVRREEAITFDVRNFYDIVRHGVIAMESPSPEVAETPTVEKPKKKPSTRRKKQAS